MNMYSAVLCRGSFGYFSESLTHCGSRPLLIQIHIRIQAWLSPNSDLDPRSWSRSRPGFVKQQIWQIHMKFCKIWQIHLKFCTKERIYNYYIFLCELTPNSRRSLLSFKEDFSAGKFKIFSRLETMLAFLDPAPLTQLDSGSAILYTKLFRASKVTLLFIRIWFCYHTPTNTFAVL